MVRITVDLIRKRSEHNEGEISTLEEISLHQENIERIELIDKLCRGLRILLLQYNLISKIENLHMLKRLEYLNLALNNIEAIENLEGLESLKKLDLTVNFIGDLRGVESLRRNENLEQLILTGNPCTDYEGYREYVVATLTQLKELDMVEIERSERIKALQVYARAEGDVIRGYREYRKIRESQLDRHREEEKLKITEIQSDEDHGEAENERFWKQTSHHTPEDRVAIAERVARREERRDRAANKGNQQPKYAAKLFGPDGRPYNVNQPKIPFRLNDEDDRDNVVLDVGVYRHLDTSHIDVDVQPGYVRVTVKGKILQLTLPCEVSPGGSEARRNSTTGSLVISMPRLNPSATIGKPIAREGGSARAGNVPRRRPAIPRREFLEIGSSANDLDFSRIVDDPDLRARPRGVAKGDRRANREEERIEDFIDDPEVPPLE